MAYQATVWQAGNLWIWRVTAAFAEDGGQPVQIAHGQVGDQRTAIEMADAVVVIARRAARARSRGTNQEAVGRAR